MKSLNYHFSHTSLRRQVMVVISTIAIILLLTSFAVIYPATKNLQDELTYDRLTSAVELKVQWVQDQLFSLASGINAISQLDEIEETTVKLVSLFPPARSSIYKQWLQQRERFYRQIRINGRPLTEHKYRWIARDMQAFLQTTGLDASLRDLLIVRPQDGMVVFAQDNTPEFLTSLMVGPYADTNLGRCFREIVANPGYQADPHLVMEDFENHDNQTQACIAAPVFSQEKLAGVLIAKLDIYMINNIMQRRPGLGDSGETYIVGQDLFMRSDSRFYKDSSILTLKVDTPATHNAIRGFSGQGVIKDYRGTAVFSVWRPLSILGVRWALIGEIEVAEAFEQMNRNFFQLLMIWLGGLVILAWLTSRFIRRLVRPLGHLTVQTKRMASGRYGEAIDNYGGSAEIQQLVANFNEMAHQIEQRTQALEFAKREAELSTKEATEADAAKGEFLSNMSHELRTPLNGILGYVQVLLRSTELNQTQQKNLQAIESCGHHLLELINDVLDISKIESGTLEVHNENVNFKDLIESVVHIVKPRADEKKIELSVDYAIGVSDEIYADPSKLRQILINLIGNSVKFTDSGFVQLRINYQAEQNHLQFDVKDSGMGISPDHIDDIFDPFKQGSGGKNSGGTGLGLAISKQLCEAMGGRLWVESLEHVGSTFSFTIPYKLMTDDSTDNFAIPALNHRYTLAGGHQARALVIDEKAINRDVLSQLLEDVGIDAVCAQSHEQAHKLLSSESADVVLVDIRQPVIENLDIVRSIRSCSNNFGVPIVALTASVMQDSRTAIMEAGCDRLLVKPYQADVIYQTIAELIELDSHILEADPTPQCQHPKEPLILFAEQRQEFASGLRQAAKMGDITTLSSIADQISGHPGGLFYCQEIHRLIDDFDFGAIETIATELETA